MFNRKILYFAFGGILVLLIGLSFWANIDTYSNEKIDSKVLSTSSSGLDISKDMIKVQYVSSCNSHDVVNPKEYSIIDEVTEIYNNESKEILSEKQLPEIILNYSKNDYRFKGIDNNVITFSRTLDKYKYEPNKFVIGIKGDYITIFKSDESGNLSEEIKDKDLRPIPTIYLKKYDVLDIAVGDKKYQYDTLEEAIEAMQATFNS